MKKILTSLLAIGAIAINAQTIERQVIASTGGTLSNSSVEITSTAGESVVTTFTSGSFTLTQGYHQASGVNTSIKETKVITNYKIYPNPAVESATLELTTENADAFVSIILYNIEGKLVYTNTLNLKTGIKSVLNIDLSNQTKGIYYINILDENSKLSESIELIKN